MTNEPIEAETIDQDPPTTEEAPPPRQMALEQRRPQAEPAKPQITAAQAKVEAVAALTMRAYERASELELTPEEEDKLKADFPDEAFQPGAAGKENLIYIEHAALRERLTSVFGMGKWAIVPRNRWAEPFTLPARERKPAVSGSRVYVEAMLVIRGCFVGEAVGEMEYYPSNNSQNYGDAVEGAKTAALRRCCKELGVGLQAWKKDWCNGWWARRKLREKSSRTAQAAAGGVTTPAASQTPQGVQAASTGVTPGAKVEQKPKFASQATLNWLIVQLKPILNHAVAYYRALVNPAALLPTDPIEALGLEFCPLSRDELKLLEEKIQLFTQTGKAEHAFKPHDLKDPPKSKPATTSKAPGAEAAKSRDPEWFFDIICPIPRAGMKRAEYQQNPDTIGSLYKGMKEGDEACQKRLWGMARNWAPAPREHNGTTYQPTQSDFTFREALDAFLEWEEKHGQDTQAEAQPELPAGQDDDIPM